MGQKCVRTTTYHAFMMFKPHRSKTAVRVEKTGSDPLDLSVSASKSGGEVVVSIVNPRQELDAAADLSFAGVTARQATARILHHTDLNAYNSFDEPDRITPKSHPVKIENGRLRLDVPAMSVVTILVQAA
jgi:alpha-N-arabinofuranosidase